MARSRVYSLNDAAIKKKAEAARAKIAAQQSNHENPMVQFHLELMETCIDALARYAFSTSASLPKRSPVTEFLLEGGQTQSWLVSNKIITITTSGGAKVTDAGMCQSCRELCQSATDRRYHAGGHVTVDSDASSAQGSPAPTRRRHKSAAVKSSSKAIPLKQLSQDDILLSKQDREDGESLSLSSESQSGDLAMSMGIGRQVSTENKTEKLLMVDSVLLGLKAQPKAKSIFSHKPCSCWCTQWAEIHVRRATGNLSWVLRIQNAEDLAESFPEFPLSDISSILLARDEELPVVTPYRPRRKKIDSMSLAENEYDSLLSEHFQSEEDDTGSDADDNWSEDEECHKDSKKDQDMVDLSPSRMKRYSSSPDLTSTLHGRLASGHGSPELLQAWSKAESLAKYTGSKNTSGVQRSQSCRHRNRSGESLKIRHHSDEASGGNDGKSRSTSEENCSSDARSIPRKRSHEKVPAKIQSGEKSTSRNPSGEKSTSRNPSGEKATSRNPSGEKATSRNPSGEKATSRNPSGEKATSRNPSGEKATSRNPSGEKSASRNPSGEKSPHPRTPPEASRQYKVSESSSIDPQEVSDKLAPLKQSNEAQAKIQEDHCDGKARSASDSWRTRGHLERMSSTPEKPKPSKLDRSFFVSPLETQQPDKMIQGGISPSFLFLQLFHSHYQLEGERRPVSLPLTNQVITRAIKMLDLIHPFETHKIGVIYVGRNQASDETSILANQYGSLRYTEFLKSLGHLVRLAECGKNKVYVGGLDYAGVDGQFAYVWHDDFMQVVYHVATLMPSKENDPKCNAKKLHIGNDYVTIVYNDSGDDYEFGTIKGQFNYVNIIITPVDHGSNIVTVTTKEDIKDVIGHNESKIISDSHVGTLVRQMAVHGDLASTIHERQKQNPRDPFASNWLERLRQIKRMRQKVNQEAAKLDKKSTVIIEDFTDFV